MNVVMKNVQQKHIEYKYNIHAAAEYHAQKKQFISFGKLNPSEMDSFEMLTIQNRFSNTLHRILLMTIVVHIHVI